MRIIRQQMWILIFVLVYSGVSGCLRHFAWIACKVDTSSEDKTEDPKGGTCYCITKKAAIRTTGCKETGEFANPYECMYYKGRGIKQCPIKGIMHNFLRVDYHGKEKLISKVKLTKSPPQLCTRCDTLLLKDQCPTHETLITQTKLQSVLDAEGITYDSNALTDMTCYYVQGLVWLWRKSSAHFSLKEANLQERKLVIEDIDSNLYWYIPWHFEYTGLAHDGSLIYMDSNGFTYLYSSKQPRIWEMFFTASCVKSYAKELPKVPDLYLKDKNLFVSLPEVKIVAPKIQPFCQCVHGNDIVARDADCKEIPHIKVSTGRCFQDGGYNIICNLNGSPVNYRKLDLNGQEGWLPSEFLKEDPGRSTLYCDCGRKKFTASGKPVSFIIGGHNATLGEWPWQALFLEDDFGICGASVINNHWVLTAAHCIDYEEETGRYKIKIGGIHRYKNETTTQILGVNDIKIHEKYSGRHYCNDIALVRTAAKINFTNYVQPICLPEYLIDMTGASDCYSTGWGITSYGGYGAKILQEVQTPIASMQRCKEKITYDIYPEVNLCAGLADGSATSCKGDSGGPVACRDRFDTWTLVGIHSTGLKCSTYGVKAKVSSYVKWIKDTIY